MYFSHSIVRAYRLSRVSIMALQKRKGRFTCEEFSQVLRQEAEEMDSLLVPKYNGEFRIKAVTDMAFEDIRDKSGTEIVLHKQREYIFANEPHKLSQTRGILIFCCTKGHPNIQQLTVSFEFCKLMHSVYGLGFNQRTSVHSIGPNIYRGARCTSRCGAFPYVSLEHCGLQDYCNNNQSFPLCQILVEKVCNELTQNVLVVAKQLHPEMMELAGDSCSKSILTCGAPALSVAEDDEGNIRFTRPKASLYAFLNQPHNDPLDCLGEAKEDLAARLTTPYSKRLLESELFCMPTTCCYQHVWDNGRSEESEIGTGQQHFSLDGISVGIPIEDGLVTHFLANAFTHSTTLAYVKWQHGSISVSNKEKDIFFILAWGRGGGKTTHRYR